MLVGAYNNASSAMEAMTQALGTISQNISNVNSTGYKGVTTQFQTQLSEHLGSATDGTQTGSQGTNIFGVSAYNVNSVSTQGVLQSTNVATNMAIDGKGFFCVGSSLASGAPPSTGNISSDSAVMYTRNGAFSTAINPATVTTANPSGDGKQYLVDGSGDYLMGWMANNTGAVTQGALVPVYSMPTSVMPGVATSTATVQANIPSNDTSTQDPQYSAVPLTDPEGNAQNLALTWSRVDASTWNVNATSIGGGTLGAGTNSYTVTTDSSGNITSPSPANVPFDVVWADGSETTPSVNLTPLRPTFSTESIPVSVYDATSGSHTINMNFEKTAANTWNLYIDTPEAHQSETSSTILTDASGTATTMNLNWTPLGGNSYTVTPSSISGGDAANGSVTVTLSNGVISQINGNPVDPATNPTSQGFFSVTSGTGLTSSPNVDLSASIPTFASVSTTPVSVTFNGNGSITSVGGAAAAGSYVAQAGVTWANGQTSNISIDLSKLTQFSGAKAQINNISQDGYPDGSQESAAFDTSGRYVGQFSNGKSLTLFQVPVATFVSENNLESISGTLFKRTAAAGGETVQSVDQVGLAGGVGAGSTTIVGGSLEGSNVDLGAQFSNMILAQKAYSTNSEVFKTADEMMTVARDLHT